MKKFSLFWYLFFVCLFSWPFQIMTFVFQSGLYSRYILNSLSMIMVTVATFYYGKYILKVDFKNAGWSFGKPINYLLVLLLPVFIWIVPSILDLLRGSIILPPKIQTWQIFTILIFFVLTIIPAFGEEFGWRGFMLPQLAIKYSPKIAVLIHALIWWLWHLPILLENFYYFGASVSIATGLTPKLFGVIFIYFILSGLPAIAHGILFAYIWTTTNSLAVAVCYHVAIDAVRDSIQITTGIGPIAGLWMNVSFVLIGVVLMWKGDWNRLSKFSKIN